MARKKSKAPTPGSPGIIKGKPKSGRIWKRENQRKSVMINVKPLHKSWARKEKERSEKQSVKKFENELKEATKMAKEEKRKRAEEHKQRREENIKKAEVVQKITNTAKIKRMKKKHLKQIQKR